MYLAWVAHCLVHIHRLTDHQALPVALSWQLAARCQSAHEPQSGRCPIAKDALVMKSIKSVLTMWLMQENKATAIASEEVVNLSSLLKELSEIA